MRDSKTMMERMNAEHPDKVLQELEAKHNHLRCGFCFDREQGRHGEIKREWSPEWLMFIPVCRKHALADGMDAATGQSIIQTVP